MNTTKLTIANDHYALMYVNGNMVTEEFPNDGDTYTLTHQSSEDDPDHGKTWSFVFVEDHWEIVD